MVRERSLSARELVSPANVLFLIAGLYFIILAALGESSVYVSLGAVVCFIAALLSLKMDLFFAGAWRVASAVFVVILTVAQLVTVGFSGVASSIVVASGFVNGALFILFVGVLLSVSKEVSKKAKKEEEEEEKKSKKLTYEV
jgi:membrane-bound ClpP family serine protease